jgi:GTP-binding protein
LPWKAAILLEFPAFGIGLRPLSPIQQARFLLSAASVQDFPAEAGPELAFAGRSNVGKSSAINALAGRKRLAFSSKTPGRTQTINFFELGDTGRLADLPGYGYASVPQALRASWDALIGGYLRERKTLAGVVVLMDARRPLTKNDRDFLEWLRPVAAPRLVLLSKCDKLSRAERAAALAGTRAALDQAAMTSQVVLFSSKDGDGVEDTRALLDSWLCNKKPPEKGN